MMTCGSCRLSERDTWHLSRDKINCTVKYLNQLATESEDSAIPRAQGAKSYQRGIQRVTGNVSSF